MDNSITQLAAELESCRTLLTALGDEVRQHLILSMMLSGQCSGIRVTEIAERTNLSRPAVSHHLQILKRAGIVKMRREGTKNYYYFDTDMESIDSLIAMLLHVKSLMEALPDRSGED